MLLVAITSIGGGVSEATKATIEHTTTPVHAETNTEDIQTKAKRLANEYGVPFEVFDSIIDNESKWGEKREGDFGKDGVPCAYGLVHINICQNPDIKKEQAQDDDFSLNYLGSEIKAGREWKWSICNCVAYVKIKGAKIPKIGDAKNLETNRIYPVVSGVIKLKYGEIYHLAYIEKVTTEGIQISEYNKDRCKFGRRVVNWGSQEIVGYWSDVI